MASFFSFNNPFDLEVRLENEGDRQTVEVKGEKDRKEDVVVYYDGESVRGQVRSSFACFGGVVDPLDLGDGSWVDRWWRNFG